MTIDQASLEPLYRQVARILQGRSELVSCGLVRRCRRRRRRRSGSGWAGMRSEMRCRRCGIGTFVRLPAEDVAVVRVGAGTRVGNHPRQ